VADLTIWDPRADHPRLVRDTEWRHIAARQAGVVHLKQLARCKVSRSAVHRLVAAGILRRVHPQVYALVGAPRSFLQNAWAAQLWSGNGTLCARTSARLLDLDITTIDDVDVQVEGRRSTPDGVTIWRGPISKEDATRFRGLRVTTMPRTVIDCARRLTERETDILLDSAIRRGMFRSVFLSRMEAVCVPGRPGGRLIRRLVSERETEQGLTGSAFERLLLRTIKRAHLPTPVSQWPCIDHEFRAYIDSLIQSWGSPSRPTAIAGTMGPGRSKPIGSERASWRAGVGASSR
jgi:hypothetical protein